MTYPSDIDGPDDGTDSAGFGGYGDRNWCSPSSEPYVHVMPSKEALHEERVRSYMFDIETRCAELIRF